MKGSRILAFPPSQCTDIKPRSCVLYPFNCFSPLHFLSCFPLSNNNLDSTPVNIMPSHPEPKVPASTVDKNSAKSPSDTNGCFCDGTGGCFLCDFHFVSCDAPPVEEYRTYHPSSLGVVSRQAEMAAVEASVWNNGSKCDGDQEVKTELPAVSNLSNSCPTNTARTEHTRNLNSRSVRGRHAQSAGTGRRVGKARAFTRSQGQVSSEEDGASTTGGRTAVGIKDDVGQKVIKKEKL
jgi:hypothetical protein